VKLSTPDAAGKVTHLVQPGETLWSIAVAYKVTLASLYTINNLTAQSVIIPGQKLTIRLPGTGLTETPTEYPTPSPTFRPTVTRIPTSTPPDAGLGNPSLKSSPAAQTTAESVTPQDGGNNWRRLFVQSDPLLGIIILFMASGILLILVGRLMGKKSKP